MKSRKRKILSKKSVRISGKKIISAVSGFTLVEILVAIAILASLTGGIFVTLNPARQLSKAKDAVSQQGLVEIKNALELYFQDNNCYPDSESVFITSLNTGGPWIEGSTTYIAEAPLDGYGNPYIYMTEPSVSCPQWYVVFAKLSGPGENDICPLDEQSECIPAGFDDSWACVTGGITGCGVLASSEVSGTAITYPTSTPVPSGTITPTPTTYDFTIAMPATMRPQFFTGNISTLNPTSGQEMTLNIDTDGFVNPYPVTSVTATVRSDNETKQYNMFLSSGDAQNGGWSSTWIQNDTVNTTFIITLTARDSANNTSTVDVVIR